MKQVLGSSSCVRVKTEMETYFEQYQPMICWYAYKVARKYSVDQEDVVAQGYLLFVEALKRFDETKAKFSTYLYHNLRMLNDYCSEKRRKTSLDSSASEMILDEFWYSDYDTFESTLSKMDAISKLSEDSQKVLSYILHRDWETPGFKPSRPYFNHTYEAFSRLYDWTPSRVKKSWMELTEWWSANSTAF